MLNFIRIHWIIFIIVFSLVVNILFQEFSTFSPGLSTSQVASALVASAPLIAIDIKLIIAIIDMLGHKVESGSSASYKSWLRQEKLKKYQRANQRHQD